jgi:DNA-nicking Smr family endonuclease
MSRKLSAHEAALWRAVARTAAPLPGKNLPVVEEAVNAEAAKPAPKLNPTPISHVRPKPARAAPVADRGGEKRVRRGTVEIAASFDLHGYTQDSAQSALRIFIEMQRLEGARVVLIVTGKGGRGASAGEGVLKRRLPSWLDGPAIRPSIAGYAEAHRRHGGGGAYYVFLKRAERES